jgi:hypothetical protein
MRFILAITILVFSVFPAYAQNGLPGQPCTVNGAYGLTGGTSNSGVGNIVTCNGTTWVKVLSFDTDGVVQPQFTNTGSCSDGQVLTFNAASGGMTCGVTDTIDPIWITAAGTIATTNVNLAISQVVAASDESGSPTYNKVSGAGWLNVATNGTVTGGAPASGGTYSIIVRATDGSGNTADRTFDVVVNAGGGPAGCVNPGDICPDFTIYAGETPDGDVDYFTTQASLPGTYAFNDGTGNNLDTVITNCANVESTCRTGQSNTNAMMLADSATTTGGVDPHNAALACFCLGETHTNAPNGVVPSECTGDPQGTNALEGYGHDDWYLPSIAELDVMYVNLVSPGDTDNPTYQDGPQGGNLENPANDGPAAGSFGISTYWSSSEENTGRGWFMSFNNGSTLTGFSNTKGSGQDVRCVRK